MAVFSRRNVPPTDVLNVPGAYTRSDLVGTSFSFSGREADYTRSSVVQLRMCGAVTLFPLYVSVFYTRTIYSIRMQAEALVSQPAYGYHTTTAKPQRNTNTHRTRAIQSMNTNTGPPSSGRHTLKNGVFIIHCRDILRNHFSGNNVEL